MTTLSSPLPLVMLPASSLPALARHDVVVAALRRHRSRSQGRAIARQGVAFGASLADQLRT
eukprot:2434404-Alexandrium_andersonii.AAC.1